MTPFDMPPHDFTAGELPTVPPMANGEISNVSRRFILGAGAVSAFVLAFGVPGRVARAEAAGPPLPGATPTLNTFTAFLKIAPDETITFMNPFIEGGQGTFTSLPQIVADELDADIGKFNTVVAPPGPEYRLQFGGHVRFVGGSSSVRMSYMIWRQVGATARAMLIQAAAQKWRVPAGEITTEPGFCLHAASQKKASYGSLAAAAAALTPPTNVPLKDKAAFRYIGKSVKRVDAYDKTTGRTEYGMDVRFDGMFYAAVRSAPLLGSEIQNIGNRDAVLAMPGVHSIHPLPEAVGVVATSFYRAKKALDTLELTWTKGDMPPDFSSESRIEALKGKFDQTGISAEKVGDAAAAFKSAAHTIEAVYSVPYLAHVTMEPQNSTARFNEDGTLDVWVPNQAPDQYHVMAAKDSGLDMTKIRVHSPLLGGFFGRRVAYGHEPMTQAILLAKASGKPVKVVWTREEDITRDFFRPLGAVKARAAFDASGNPTAIHFTAPGEGPGSRMVAVGPPPPLDTTVVEGLVKKPYAIPNKQVDFVALPQRSNVGYWRSVGHSMNDFFSESFIDEIAEQAKKDPYEMRLAMVEHSPRHATLLKAVAALAGGWKSDTFTVDGVKRAMGVAMASPFDTEIAAIAEVSVTNGDIAVHHLYVAVDPGAIINPGIAKAQIQSGCCMGLSQALLEEINFDKGQVVQTNFDTYRVLPLDRMPQIHIELVESGAMITGLGEIGVPAIAPAVANAVARLTGRRIRSLPLTPEKLRIA